MLEHEALRIGPWSPGGDGLETGRNNVLAMHRRIEETETGLFLGTAGWPAANETGWRGWWGRRQVELTETEDASVVATLYRGWLQPWDVLDAEERWVGTIYPKRIVDGLGRLIRLVSRSQGAEFRDDTGATIATWSCPRPADWGLLRFAPTNRFDPFRRMVVLAATAVLQPIPKRRKEGK